MLKHFLDRWESTFPEYFPDNGNISIFTEGSGGRLVPAFARFCEEDESVPLHIDTLGIFSGCVDVLIQAPAYADMADNNTYDLHLINETVYDQLNSTFNTPNTGCRDQTLKCQNFASRYDPDSTGNNDAVNTACATALKTC